VRANLGAQPGAEIVSYLLAQTPPTAETGGWGNSGASKPGRADERRMRNWIMRDGSDGGVQPQPARVERRGFFRRLFGG
jgi:hypothetical protein